MITMQDQEMETMRQLILKGMNRHRASIGMAEDAFVGQNQNKRAYRKLKNRIKSDHIA